MGYAPISKIVTAPSPALTGTSLTITEDAAPRFPNAAFVCLVWAEGETPVVGSNAEYIQVTGKLGDVFTIVRSSGAPVAIEAGWMIAAVEVIPNYERGDTVTLRGHFAEDVPPYRVHVREPDGGTALYDAATDDSAGNVGYTFVPDKSGLWAYRWEGADGHLEDASFYVNVSTAL